MRRSIAGGPGYTSPSRKSPGLLLFLVDRSLPNQGNNSALNLALTTIYEQIDSIKDRFRTNNKQRTFRIVIIEFANAPQRRGTYFVDDYAENINAITYNDNLNAARVSGTSLKKVLDEANTCIQYHLKNYVSDTRNSRPPISVIMFSGNVHDQLQDYDYNPTHLGVATPSVYRERTVADYLKPLLNKEYVFFGVFNFIKSGNKGERVDDASVITKHLMDSALEAEMRYGVLPGHSIRDVWPNPYDLVNNKFIFNAKKFAARKLLPRFLAAMLKLGTYTSTSSDDSEEDQGVLFD